MTTPKDGTTKKRATAPDWLLERERITQRQWRQLKRRELKAVIKAFDIYRIGCAYTPTVVNGDTGKIDEILKRMKQSHSCKEWGK